MELFVQIKGKEYGPFGIEKLKTFADKNKIQPDTLVKKKRGKKWYDAYELVKDIFDVDKLKTYHLKKYPPKPIIKHKYAKLAGVTKGRRQSVISKCEIGSPLLLYHEDNNRVDPNAIKVLTQSNQELGYLPAYLAADVVDKLEQGYNVSATLADITGGISGKLNYGCNVVVIFSKNVDAVTTQKYFDDNIRSELLERIAEFKSRSAKKDTGCLIASILFLIVGFIVYCST